MRRALLVLLAVPALALGQTTGSIVADSNTINAAQCTGIQNQVRGGDDNLQLGLTWAITLAEGATFNTLGKYRVWASNLQPSVDAANGRPCEVTTNTGTFTHGQVAEFDATSSPVTTKQEVSTQLLASAAGVSCTGTTSTTIYLCVQWIDVQNGSVVNGWATTSNLALNLTAPTSAPTITGVAPGDAVLHVSCSGNDSVSTSFKAIATPAGGGTSRSSGESTDCSGLTISKLTNGQEYSVVVYGLSDAKNPSPASAAVAGTPIPTEDFWTYYRQKGGEDQGGCSTAAGATGLLGALALLALRRRTP